MPSAETVERFLGRVRERLNEPFDPEGNFWKQHELLDYLNEGLREVWQVIREAHEDWFVRTIRSTDGKLTIAGRDYDPSFLRMQTGRTELLLPPDFRELRLLEPLQPDDPEAQPQVLFFQFTGLSMRIFREGAGRQVHENTTTYKAAIERRTTGAVIVLSVVPNLVPSRDLVLKYVAFPPKLEFASTLELVGFEEDQLDAVLAFCLFRAHSKPGGDPQDKADAAGEWERKRVLALRGAGPRQTRDPEVVNGFMEDELDYI